MSSLIKPLGLESKPTNHFDYSQHIVGIAVSVYHRQITQSLLQACMNRLNEAGILKKNIFVLHAPGAYELPLGCKKLLSGMFRPEKPQEALACHAAVALGCVIQGQTRHFEFIAQAVANGCMDLSLQTGKPVAFGVLTTDTLEQALDRSGGKLGNKGIEAADAILAMLAV